LPHPTQAICDWVINAWAMVDVDDVVAKDQLLPVVVAAIHLVFESQKAWQSVSILIGEPKMYGLNLSIEYFSATNSKRNGS
jgi:hypothetical protein